MSGASVPSPVIVALDVESLAQADAMVARIGTAADHYKVGLQLLTEAGPESVRRLVSAGKSVFLDLKLHEVPHSVAGGVKAAGKLGASMVTVHASAGGAALRAAVEAAGPFPALKVLALTVITSLSDSDLPEIGLPPSVFAQVERLARLAASCGCHGVVASVREASHLRSLLPKGFLLVTPGIQVDAGVSRGQARTASPAAAFEAGATHIVVGRAITAAADPGKAFQIAASGFSQALHWKDVARGGAEPAGGGGVRARSGPVALAGWLSQATRVTLGSMRQLVFRRLHRPWGRCALALLLVALLSAGMPQDVVHAHEGGDPGHHHFDDHDQHGVHAHDHHPAASQAPTTGDGHDQAGDRDGGALLHCHAGSTVTMIMVTAGENLLFTAMTLPSPSPFAGDPPASTTHPPPHRPPIA